MISLGGSLRPARLAALPGRRERPAAGADLVSGPAQDRRRVAVGGVEIPAADPRELVRTGPRSIGGGVSLAAADRPVGPAGHVLEPAPDRGVMPRRLALPAAGHRFVLQA